MATPAQILKDNLLKAMKIISNAGKEELRQQGHRASGKLEASFEERVIVRVEADIAKGQVLTESYGTFQDTGLRPASIRYSPTVLLPWARIVKPTLSEKELKSFVYAIKAKQKKTGMPTRGGKTSAFDFTKNGRRTGWIEATANASIKDIEKILVQGLADYTAAVVSDIISELNKLK